MKWLPYHFHLFEPQLAARIMQFMVMEAVQDLEVEQPQTNQVAVDTQSGFF